MMHYTGDPVWDMENDYLDREEESEAEAYEAAEDDYWDRKCDEQMEENW